MNFTIPPGLMSIQEQMPRFIAEQITSAERTVRCALHGPDAARRREIIDQANNTSLFSLQMPVELGGLGLDHYGKANVFEDAGNSPLGPVELNIAAPDEGNMHRMEVVATPEQRTCCLHPPVAGKIPSCSCTTEPHPGAGLDPSMLTTTATPAGDDFQINGRKRFITEPMARFSPLPGQQCWIEVRRCSCQT